LLTVNASIDRKGQALFGVDDLMKKNGAEKRSTRDDYSGPKWGYRLLIIFGIFAVMNLVAQFTLRSEYSEIYISLITGVLFISVILGILNRTTGNMFEENYHQYGFYLIIFLIFSLYGNSMNYRDTADLLAYSKTPEFIDMAQMQTEKYFHDNPTVDTLSYAAADSIAYSLILRSSEGFSILSRTREHRILGYSASFPFLVFLVLFITSYVRFKIVNFRLRREWDREHGLR
jgi:hypothetical protein